MQYKNTNSGSRNLLNVKSHIKKIGFELVLKNSTVWYGAQFCRKTVPCNWPSKREGTFSELGLQMWYGVAGGVWGGTRVTLMQSSWAAIMLLGSSLSLVLHRFQKFESSLFLLQLEESRRNIVIPGSGYYNSLSGCGSVKLMGCT